MLVFLLIYPLNAQVDPSAGIQMWSTNEFGIDLATSVINLRVPLRAKAGPIPFSSALVGTSHAWSWRVNTYTSYIEVDRGLNYIDPTRVQVNNTLGSCNAGASIRDTNFVVVDWTGAAHPFPAAFSINEPPCTPTPGSATTTDGSGYTIVTNGSSAFTVYDRSGRKWNGLCGSGCWVSPTAITDPDGNSISLQSQGTGVTDSLNTTVLSFGSSISYTTTSGNVSYTYGWTSSTNLKTNFGCGGQSINSPESFLSSVALPDGGKYQFAYEPTPNGNGFTNDGTYFTGRIAKVTFPDGGSISYGYSGGYNGFDCVSAVPTITVTVNDNNGNTNQWTYVRFNGAPGGAGGVIKTDPAGNQTLYYFQGEFNLQTITYQGGCPTSITGCNGGGTLLRTITTCYNGNFTNCQPSNPPSPVLQLPISQTDVYTSFNGGPSNLVETKYDTTYGNVLEVKRYGFGAAMPPTGNPISDTVISYGQYPTCGSYPAGIYIYDTPCYIQTTDSSGAVVAATKIGHNNTGHPTSIGRWVSGTKWLWTYASFNSNGTMQWSQDAAGNKTTYGY